MGYDFDGGYKIPELDELFNDWANAEKVKLKADELIAKYGEEARGLLDAFATENENNENAVTFERYFEEAEQYVKDRIKL
jgi:Mlc titration factor MtfA (ptsG expression regulator)